ncbi:hypothetical protein PEX2_033990 [Penicillium expansum]|uniref:Uncharacterized protein n=1 Tax=Penicillium expansum TaxID=27334 RepID=A0A0A2K7Q7_PENEN|nr:hypothetical protein PEX2_033990 [Penicillium expansum]KGO60410.1 hypothetical protein PEX2_033990 [Penicillium expansum]
MRTEYRLEIIRLFRFQREHIWNLRQAGPGLVATFPLNRKTTVQAHFRCRHQDLIRGRGPHLTSTAVPRMFLYYQRRLVLAADLAHVKLGRGLRRSSRFFFIPRTRWQLPTFDYPATQHTICRSLPSLLDPAVEKRLAQLDVDKEKLLEQIAETQRSKRAELRDWDRLDRESSICALKSELAEGHLQRMADESIGGGNLF